ncbi:RlmE family RNA methyltransferase [Patescibacteria group bacterium]|nr:RlmE family RNA methyltransferase [Patescibacteria group bacterium]MBU1682444.1 RlmE family RNA methyltransferase [Patescibacteria group bacterium]MBU1935705.1 RlmE family RNA methyltransferase [Patescibacteria group bacterium]
MSKQFDPQDKYFNRAKQEGYRARSAFKLEEIQERYKIIKPGDKVLDLGAAPGSFLQYIFKVVGEKGIAVGIDLQEIESFPDKNILTFKGDIYDEKLYKKIVQQIGMEEFDVITSDLAPKTSGVKFVDGGRSLDLSLQVLEIAKNYLKKDGGCVMKILPGFNEGELLSVVNKMFKTVKKFRPKAVRKSSGESYVICLDKL